MINKKLRRLYAKLVILVLCFLIIARIFVLVLSKYESISNSYANVDIAFYLLKEDFQTMTLNLASILPQNNAYTFEFSIGNQAGEDIAEVDIEYELTLRTTTNLPLTYELYMNEEYTNEGATNIIKDPVLSVITGIALDHTAILGDTIEKIASEKAGIIKPCCPVLLGCASADSDSEAVEKVIYDKAKECGSAFYKTDFSSLSLKSATINGTVIDYAGYSDIKIPLLGLYQQRNAANVLSALDILIKLGYNIGKQAVFSGISKTVWKARFEKISDDPMILFDGSHNPQGITEAVRSIKQYFGNDKVIIVTGVMADKSYEEMVSMISSVAFEVFTLTPNNTRSLSSDMLAEVYRSFGVKATACTSIVDAVSGAYKRAKEARVPIFALGSLYMYSDVKNAVITEKMKDQSINVR